MGPDATVDLYNKIIVETRRKGAARDQDHIEVIISSVPQTPDRTEAILHGGAVPAPELIRSAQRLERAGADFLVIACITAHHFIGEVSASVGIPLLDAVALTAAHIAARYPLAARAGILATDGTLATRLFHSALEKHGIEPLEPSFETQRSVMTAIYGSEGLKSVAPSQSAIDLIRAAAAELVERGAQVVIAGCTEIPLAFNNAAAELEVPLVDATSVLAQAAVERALGLEREAKDAT